MFGNILNQLDELDIMYKKINLLERKKKKMGLNEEENQELSEKSIIYYDLFQEVMNKLIEELIDSLLSEKGKKALQRINRIVSWNGKSILTVDDFERILDDGKDLSDKEIEKIEKNLIELHLDIFKGFEYICKEKSIYNALEEIGSALSIGKSDGIQNIVTYIDDMYKDFGEIFGIELPEVKLFYY